MAILLCCFFFSSRRRHTRYWRDWSSDVCSSDLKCRFYAHGTVTLQAPWTGCALKSAQKYLWAHLAILNGRSIYNRKVQSEASSQIILAENLTKVYMAGRIDRQSTRLNSSHA